VTNRIPLTIIAGVTGAALMYIVVASFNVLILSEHAYYSRIGVVAALVVLVVGWMKIYCNRPAHRRSALLHSEFPPR
jgi:hypothetical protein